jgi:hypothetical protein
VTPSAFRTRASSRGSPASLPTTTAFAPDEVARVARRQLALQLIAVHQPAGFEIHRQQAARRAGREQHALVLDVEHPGSDASITSPSQIA